MNKQIHLIDIMMLSVNTLNHVKVNHALIELSQQKPQPPEQKSLVNHVQKIIEPLSVIEILINNIPGNPNAKPEWKTDENPVWK
jgi:hypothetical protein